MMDMLLSLSLPWFRCFQVASLPWLKRKAASVIGTIPNSSYEEAISYFEKANAANPHPFAPNWLYLGKCYMQQRKWAEAKQWFTKIIQLEGSHNDPDHKEVTFSCFFFVM